MKAETIQKHTNLFIGRLVEELEKINEISETASQDEYANFLTTPMPVKREETKKVKISIDPLKFKNTKIKDASTDIRVTEKIRKLKERVALFRVDLGDQEVFVEINSKFIFDIDEQRFTNKKLVNVVTDDTGMVIGGEITDFDRNDMEYCKFNNWDFELPLVFEKQN